MASSRRVCTCVTVSVSQADRFVADFRSSQACLSNGTMRNLLESESTRSA